VDRCRRAGEYLDPVPRGIAVMAGEINPFSRGMWEEILGSSCAWAVR